MVSKKNTIQKNKLKDLIYIQENKACNKQTVKGLFRAIVEPILETKTDCVVLYRVKNRGGLEGILNRLSYTEAAIADFSEVAEWENTEFVYVLSERYGAVFIWDYDLVESEDMAGFYAMFNSKDLAEAYELITEKKPEFRKYGQRWHPDRRDNVLMNEALRKLIGTLDESNSEVILSEMTVSADEDLRAAVETADFITAQASVVSHEVRNQLSVCDLYAEVINKRIKKEDFDKESMQNAVDCIKRAVKLASTTLLDLKSLSNTFLKEENIDEIVHSALMLSRVFCDGKEIKIVENISSAATVLADESKLTACFVNLLKNAIEAIEKRGTIEISVKKADGKVNIRISNTGKPIENPTKIFESGFSTKGAARGIGLAVCKKTLNDMSAEIKLESSNEKSTVFEITMSEV